MNLKKLTDLDLHQKTLALVMEERRLTVEVLHHLREVSVRRLYAILGYSSLWEYCVKGLKYSEGSAQRRISAMRLIAEIPELEEKIKAGSVSLCAASQLQSAFRAQAKQAMEQATEQAIVGSAQAGLESSPETNALTAKAFEKMTQESAEQTAQKVTEKTADKATEKRMEKLAIIQSIEGKSRRESEKILSRIAPQTASPERRRVLNESQTEVRFIMSAELERKLQKIKALTAHQSFEPGFGELFEMLADFYLSKKDPEKKPSREKAPRKPGPRGLKQRASDTQVSAPPPVAAAGAAEPVAESRFLETTKPVREGRFSSGTSDTINPSNTADPTGKTPPRPGRYIPTATRHSLYQRAGSRCEHSDPASKRRCEETRGLQIEHVISFACGGTSDLENLQLICGTHNRLRAIQVFGAQKMQPFLKRE